MSMERKPAEDVAILSAGLKAQEANKIAVLALGRIRNDNLSAAECHMLADATIRKMQEALS